LFFFRFANVASWHCLLSAAVALGAIAGPVGIAVAITVVFAWGVLDASGAVDKTFDKIDPETHENNGLSYMP